MDAESFRHMEELLREDTTGEFQIERLLGKGGMAIVYLATEVHLSRKVAIKVLPPELTFGHGVERFKREAKTAAALDHPNIIPIYRVASGGTIFWYAMKYLEGRSLDDLLREKGRIPLDETIHILQQVADALDYAHEHQVIHRDVKPANVMLDARNRVVVTDFGIAKALTEGTLTASGSVVGTPYFMSPEQGMGRPVTGAADQYSVGVMAYRMLSGQVPFEGESAVEILHKHCMFPPPPLETVMPHMPKHVRWAVNRALEKKPEKRFSSVAALVEALRAPSIEMTLGEQETLVVAAQPLVAPAVPPSRPAPPPGISEAEISGATVPLDATPPPTPATPYPAVGRAAAPISVGVAKERKSRRGLILAALGVVALAGGWVVASVLLGPGGDAGSAEARAPTTQTAAPTGPASQPDDAVRDSTRRADSVAAALAAAARDSAARDSAARAERARALPAAPRTGTLRLTGVPAGASVQVDNERRTGGAIELITGRHRVVVSAAGFQAFDKTVEIQAGRTFTLPFDAAPRQTTAAPPQGADPRRAQVMQPSPAAGLLRISVTPPAEVIVAGRSLGVQARVQEPVIAGALDLQFRLEGFVPKDTTVTIVAGDTLTLRIRLERSQ
jgi:serine/threonine-protein kinase